MSRVRSRLHNLEHGIRKSRKAKAKAHGLTVMRLEGSQPAVRARGMTARLPKELEEQIAIVRGRRIGNPSRGLLQLEEWLLRPQESPPVLTIQRLDHGPAPAVAALPVAQAHALSAPQPSGMFSGHFNVESFEDTSTPSLAPPLNVPASETRAAQITVPKPELTAGAAPQSVNVPWEQVPTVSGAVPGSNEQSLRNAPKRALSAEQKAVAENFQRNLDAMLGTTAPVVVAPEDKQWDETIRKVTTPAPTAPAAASPSETTQVPPAGKPDAHKVFNQMGLAMNYANSFDLGAVDLSARFDQFDNELALRPKRTTPSAASVPVQALALDDFDLVADLAEISGAQAVAAPTASPACEPSVQSVVQPEPAPPTTPMPPPTTNEQAAAPVP